MLRRISLYFCLAILSCVGGRQAFAQENPDSLYKAAGPKDNTPVDTAQATDTTQTDTTALVSTQTTDTISGYTETPWYTTRTDTPGVSPLTIRSVRRLSDSTMNGLRKDDDFWYVAVGPEKKQPVEPPKPPDFKWWGFWFWAILCGLGVALIVVLIQFFTGERLFKRRRSSSLDLGEGPGGIIPPNLEETFQAAVGRQDYTTAERCLFLMALDGLGSRDLIVPGKEKTNREYLRELREHPLYSDFARLARHYEYTVYGGFAPDEETFARVHRQYEQFQNRLQTL